MYPVCRPNPRTSVTVNASTPTASKASRTSSSLRGLTIAATSFTGKLRSAEGSCSCGRSDVEVQVELPRVRTDLDRVDFPGALVSDPGLDHVVGEHPTLLQE